MEAKNYLIAVQNFQQYHSVNLKKKNKFFLMYQEALCTERMLYSVIHPFFLSTKLLSIYTGPSGCGKSSLLDVLADRKDPYGLSGTVLVRGVPRDSSYRYTVGYVVQDDICSGTLTVRENLYFSINLRFPEKLSSSQKDERVDAVIEEVGLQNCANTRVGTEFHRGISGGEKKRTCIGMELVLSPEILFLDEPTTGN